ncbi:MAG: hypothetical protein J6P69_05780 [Bacteroidales bacterium]|nr:hypothetical protein [Bacteroidales bacterium]
MERKGITKKQFWMQMISPIINLALGVMWLVVGLSGDVDYYILSLILGPLFILLSVGMICYLIILRKRHPIEDASVDREMTEGLKAGGFALMLLALGFVLAIGMALLFR